MTEDERNGFRSIYSRASFTILVNIFQLHSLLLCIVGNMDGFLLDCLKILRRLRWLECIHKVPWAKAGHRFADSHRSLQNSARNGEVCSLLLDVDQALYLARSFVSLKGFKFRV